MTKSERSLLVAQCRVEVALSRLVSVLTIEKKSRGLSGLLENELEKATEVLAAFRQADADRLAEICGESNPDPIPEDVL